MSVNTRFNPQKSWSIFCKNDKLYRYLIARDKVTRKMVLKEKEEETCPRTSAYYFTRITKLSFMYGGLGRWLEGATEAIWNVCPPGKLSRVSALCAPIILFLGSTLYFPLDKIISLRKTFECSRQSARARATRFSLAPTRTRVEEKCTPLSCKMGLDLLE